MRLAIVVLALLATPATANAATQLAGPSTPMKALAEQWIAESKAPTPTLTIELHEHNCDEYSSACMYHTKPNPVIVIPDLAYLFQPGYSDKDRVATQLLFLHELGHVADKRWRPAGTKIRYRTTFGRIMGYPSAAINERGRWLYTDDGQDPVEQFAMGYAYCAYDPYQIEPRVREAFWGYDYRPTNTQHRRVCKLIGRWL